LLSQDRTFFAAVVQPFLRNKLQKTFLDKWFLGHDLSVSAGCAFECCVCWLLYVWLLARCIVCPALHNRFVANFVHRAHPRHSRRRACSPS
jgi:hypothetical protein